ncbi:MAG: glycosyltransferase family 4 protein [Sphingobacteriaceae bacterium]|nr:glycosyltransferase family 4 protein [Sphingobacteriaceae bacterium]
MNVLFIFSRHSQDPRDSTLTKDLSDEFARQGVNVYIMTMSEKRDNQSTRMSIENGYNVLRVQTGNYFNCKTKLEKVKTIFTMPTQFVKAAKEHLKDITFDLIITHTPFVSSRKIILPLKQYFNCPAHLILWDIFPQNAWDIGIIRNRRLFDFFKSSEIKMLQSYDNIWCMSDGNVEYIKKNYPELKNIAIERLYNSAKIKPLPNINREAVRQQFGYTDEDIIALFGGNMGVPQCLENILELAKQAQVKCKNAKFLFVGHGTDTKRLMALANQMCLINVKFIEQLPREDYENITVAADIGLVSLDQRFTVPNFPSKTTDYFKLQLPILASLDSCAAQDYGYFLTDIAKAGRFALAGDNEELFNRYFELYSNTDLRNTLGKNGRQFYEQELDVAKACIKICQHFEK